MRGRPKGTTKYGETTRTVRVPVSICLERLEAWIRAELKRPDKPSR